jgi:hypothetical protein
MHSPAHTLAAALAAAAAVTQAGAALPPFSVSARHWSDMVHDRALVAARGRELEAYYCGLLRSPSLLRCARALGILGLAHLAPALGGGGGSIAAEQPGAAAAQRRGGGGGGGTLPRHDHQRQGAAAHEHGQQDELGPGRSDPIS